MGDGDKKDLVGSEASVDLSTTRTGIMLMLAPAIEAALKDSKLDMTDVNVLRRYFRAMVHLAVQRMLDVGAPHQFLIAQMLEAVGHELEARQKLAKEDPNVPPATMSN